MNTIEVNGKCYTPRQKEPSLYSRVNSKMLRIAMMYAMSMPMMGYSHNEPERPKVNIIEEYRLIELKKSNLSRAQREWVKREFHKNFIEAPDPVGIFLADATLKGMQERKDEYHVVNCRTGIVLYTGTGEECKAKYPNYVNHNQNEQTNNP